MPIAEIHMKETPCLTFELKTSFDIKRQIIEISSIVFHFPFPR